MGGIASSNGTLDIPRYPMRILNTLGDALFRKSICNRTGLDRKLTWSCFYLPQLLGLRAVIWQKSVRVSYRLVVTRIFLSASVGAIIVQRPERIGPLSSPVISAGQSPIRGWMWRARNRTELTNSRKIIP